MKPRFFPAAALLAFCSGLTAHGGIPVAVNPATSGNDAGASAFVFEAMEVQLSAKGDYELVDRQRLHDLLHEQSLSEGGMTSEQASKLGKLVGAKYYVFGNAKAAGEKAAVSCRVVQVDTGVFKPVLLVMAKDEDPLEAGDKLASQVNEAIAKLEGRTSPETIVAGLKLELPADAKRPTFAFRIPEVSVSPQASAADPAAEKTLEAFLQANDCKLVQLSRPSQAEAANQLQITTTATQTIARTRTGGTHLEGKEHEELLKEAKAKGVDILVLGVATSERAAQIGNFSTARARVELAAVSTRDSRILATTSGYGVGSDLSAFIAEKKAIESASRKLQADFSRKTIMAFNADK